MRIREILFGVAFGLSAPFAFASFVLAGEPIAIEAEPEESAKSCDKYGEGFVYVPGTNTCVKLSGEIRTTFTHSID